VHSVLDLQRHVGNQVVLRMLDPGRGARRVATCARRPSVTLERHPVLSSHALLNRQTVEQYETRGIPITQETLHAVGRYGFWGEKLEDAGFPVSRIDPLLYDAEQQNAALAVAFQKLPKSRITQEVTSLVTIPARPSVKGSQDLTCQLIFRAPGAPGQKGSIEIRFVGMGTGAKATTLDVPSTNFRTSQVNQREFTPKAHSFKAHDFPPSTGASYWDTHHEEFLRVFYWLETEAGPRFDQVLTIPLGNTSTSFRVAGKKDPSSGVADMDIFYLGTAAPSKQQAPRDYASHDFLEVLQTTRDPVHGDKLGKISGLGGLPGEERFSVEVVIWEYFKSDPGKSKSGTRNTEVDAVVPIINPPSPMATRARMNRRVLFTLRFKPKTNDVDVEKIGEIGVKGVTLEPQGSLARVNGFSAHTQGADEAARVAALVAWLKTRYRGVNLPTVTATTTVADVEKAVSAQIHANSSDPKWFEKNYGIKVLTASDAVSRLKAIGFKKTEDLKDLKDFKETELPLLELVLETMSDTMLSKFKGVQFVRQNVYFEWTAGVNTGTGCTSVGCFVKKEDTAGITRGGKSSPTITIFDAAWANVETLFLGGTDPGGKADVEPAPAATFAHELGHVVSYDPQVKKDFDALVKDKGIKPITWYAASDPPKELFAESFALYYSDPRWLEKNWPDLYKFFDALDKAPPPASKTSPSKSRGAKT
jgi:hypothetical protein